MKVRLDKPQPVVMPGGNQAHPYRKRLGAVPTLSFPTEPVPFLLLPEMVAIDAATFIMGRIASEVFGPEREVFIPAFSIGKYEVTNIEWRIYLSDGRGSPATQNARAQYMTYLESAAGENAASLLYNSDLNTHPVVNVTWHDAFAYCHWLKEVTAQPYRLPTNIEWEYVARGRGLSKYPWGNVWDETRLTLLTEGTASVNAHPEGASIQPNGDRVFDLFGNVWEWLEDNWDVNGKREFKLLRGGPIYYFRAEQLQISSMNIYAPDTRGNQVGFRVAV